MFKHKYYINRNSLSINFNNIEKNLLEIRIINENNLISSEEKWIKYNN